MYTKRTTVTLCRGTILEEIPSTPTEHPYTKEIAATQDLIKYAADNGYGVPVSYKQEHNGSTVQNLFPIKKHEQEQISSSSKAELALHTELAFHPHRPAYVHLLCLRGDEEAQTTYATLQDIVSKLDKDTLGLLYEPVFKTTIDLSFRENGEEDVELLMPILSHGPDGTIITYDQALMSGVSPEASQALLTLETIVSRCTRAVVLREGDILTINNQTTIHGRRPFTPRYDGTDRWLQRLLTRVTDVPVDELDGSVVTTVFR
jgi:L-asparagine oxygenase